MGDGRSKIVETSFVKQCVTYQCVIENFCCAHTSVNLNLEKFEFYLNGNMHFIGHLTIQGNTCSERECVLELKCTTHTNYKVLCKCQVNAYSYTECTLSQDKSKLRGLLTYGNNKCIMQKKSTIVYTITRIHKPNSTLICPIMRNKFKYAFWQLYKTNKFSDVSFQVGNKNIRAHKNILSCRSPVFEAMFEHKTQDSLTNKVLIEDMEPDVFEEMLHFIYIDEVVNLEAFAAKLLLASDKYDLPKLKLMCEQELAANITIEKAAETLILADLHRSEQLKNQVLFFMKNNMKAVLHSAGFKLLTNRGGLVVELLRAFVN